MEIDRRQPIRSLALLVMIMAFQGCSGPRASTVSANRATCNGSGAGIILPPGFCASVFADNLGHVRHMVAAADGTVFANSMAGQVEAMP